MFRTRDFILIFTVIVFLVMAISATLLTQRSTASGEPGLKMADVGDVEYEAEIYSPETLSREERLERMRRKIAEGGEIVMREPDPEPEEQEEGGEEEVSEDPIAVMTCAGFAPYVGAWPIGGVQLEVVEGARIAYREIVSEYEVDPTATASAALLPPDTRKDVLLELPIRSFSNGQRNCLPSDVIGVAQDGSLIRNGEVGLYGVFGDSTVIGYSLDGFPIHGVTSRALDACGGAVVNGQYGYYLSDEREAVLACFSATPVRI